MFKSWRLGKIFDIPIYLHPTFLLVPLLALGQNPGGPMTALVLVVLSLAVFGCVLLHELGHALMARVYGIGTRDITLYPIGGVARLNGMGNEPKQELAIALAGPAVNVAIAVLLTPLVFLVFLASGPGSAALTPSTDPGLWAFAGQFLVGLWFANIVLVLFNLLPAFPMDGGRVFRALLSLWRGQLWATEIAAKVGVVMAGLFLVAGVLWQPMLLLVAAFVLLAGQQELYALRRRAQQQTSPVLEAEPVYAGQLETGTATEHTGYSGLAWDRHSQVWVQWHNGRPIAYYGPAR